MTAAAGLLIGVVVGLVHLIGRGWVKALQPLPERPNEGIRSSIRHGLLEGAIFGLSLGGIGGLLNARVGELSDGVSGGLTYALVSGLAVGLGSGLGEALKHYVLRAFLWGEGTLPLRLIPWLESCRAYLLLRRQGGAYLFWHKSLQDYFLELDDARLTELSQQLEQRPEYVQRY